MSLLDQIKKDVQTITGNAGDFAVSIQLTAPTLEEATVNGLHTKHHLGVDTEGNMVNSRNAHISIAEALLTAAKYPARNAQGEVSMHDHLVRVADSTGVTKSYKVKEAYPDETVGLIVMILTDYEDC